LDLKFIVRKNNGDDGYVPANYVKEIDPKKVSVEVKKSIVLKDVKKVKKTQYIKYSLIFIIMIEILKFTIFVI
jgi:hypothetical protein